MVRAAVNLVVAGILISIATSYKLPLSTTYVTFMVAMGTSLADKAWGAESAVYRALLGVLNVIGGWFGTALIAFVAAGIILTIISMGQGTAIGVLLILAIFLLARNYVNYNKKQRVSSRGQTRKAESSSIQGVIEESANNISNVIRRTQNIYSNAVTGLAKQDLELLKKNKKQGAKLADEIEDLRNHIFYFIKKFR